jgi:serine/threonine protein kinase
LPDGTRLGEFELLKVIGVGGFGIVYLAFDHALEREVAVKEYMPASLAGRTETMHVSLRSQSDAETFELGRSPLSTRPSCWPASTTLRCSRCTASGKPTAPPTWPCR